MVPCPHRTLTRQKVKDDDALDHDARPSPLLPKAQALHQYLGDGVNGGVYWNRLRLLLLSAGDGSEHVLPDSKRVDIAASHGNNCCHDWTLPSVRIDSCYQ